LTTTVFWLVSYGYTGNIGDLNVLNMSPLLDRMVDITFHQLEQDSGVGVNGEEFNKCFILVDDIYPKFSRFVKGIKEPTRKEVYWVARIHKNGCRESLWCHQKHLAIP
jgi:Plant transposon protein